MKNQRLRAGVITACGAVVLTFSAVASAQECPKWVGGTWQPRLGQEPYRVEVAGDYAYLKTAHYDSIFRWMREFTAVIDVTDIEGPRIVANLRLPNSAFESSGHLMFDLDNGLTITDVSDPTNPVVG